MTAPTLEQMIFGERLFALTTPTPVQRAIARAADGRPLGELASDPRVAAAFGGSEAIATLPVGIIPERVDVYSGIRTAKSLLASAAAVCMSQRIDVSGLRPGEIPRIPILSLDRDKADVVFQHIVGTVRSQPLLRGLLVDEPTAESILLRHPSGCVVEIAPVAGKRAGGALVARWLGGVVLDEAPRMLSSEDGAVVTIDDALAASAGRILPGGQTWVIGSPWAPFGECFESVQTRWGVPGRDRVVAKAPAFDLNPVWWTSERVEALRTSNPRAYKTDVLAEFVDAESAVFPSEAIEDAFENRLEQEFDVCEPAIFIDPSQLRSDTWAAAIGAWVLPRPEENDAMLWVECDDTRARTPVGPRGAQVAFRPNVGRYMALLRDDRGEPLPNPDYVKPKAIFRIYELMGWDGGDRIAGDELVKQVVTLGRRYGARHIFSDTFEQLMLSAHFKAYEDIRFHAFAWSAATKTIAVDRLRALMVERRLMLPEHRRLRGELQRFRARATSTGFSYVVPGQGHGDYASCLLIAMRAELEGYLSGSPLRINRQRYELTQAEIAARSGY
jgi:hypothetical protein